MYASVVNTILRGPDQKPPGMNWSPHLTLGDAVSPDRDHAGCWALSGTALPRASPQGWKWVLCTACRAQPQLWAEQQPGYSPALKVSRLKALCLDLPCGCWPEGQFGFSQDLLVDPLLLGVLCPVHRSWARRKRSLKITSSPGAHVSPELSLAGFFQADPQTGKSLLSRSHVSKWITAVDNHLSLKKNIHCHFYEAGLITEACIDSELL